ncbi:MAG: response regulator transcription factor [Candidatus Sumerlaeaceae bacterium]|nr:response regulator transcription factor [Candidatus Sumerlaeaceae bacterium]
MIRLLIADDHPVIRRGLKEILSEQSGMEVVAEASNAAEVLEQVRKHKLDVVLLDITMPGRSGIDALRDIKHEYPKLPVLMLSIHPEDQYAVRVLKNGASGYLTKESAPEELVNAIHKVVAGGRYVSASLAERLAVEIGGDSTKEPHELLSDREYEVLVQIGKGKPVSQIADEMSLSVKTVSTYRTRILEKLGLENTADLIRYAIERNLE